jgi:hypothetical protein
MQKGFTRVALGAAASRQPVPLFPHYNYGGSSCTY